MRFLALDKVAHFLEYAVFAFLVYRSAWRFRAGDKSIRPLLLSGGLLVLFAFVSETLQHFVPGRHLDPRDIAADLLGGILVLLFLELRRLRRIRREGRQPL